MRFAYAPGTARSKLLATVCILLCAVVSLSTVEAQPREAPSHGEKPPGFDGRQPPTDQAVEFLQPLELHYPEAALDAGLQGITHVNAWIDAMGYVSYATVITSSGYAILDSAALKAVVNGYFSPARRDGAAVASRVSIPVEFRLHREEDDYDAVKSSEELLREKQELQRAKEMLEEETRALEEELRRLREQQEKQK
jgi:TonB family protein